MSDSLRPPRLQPARLLYSWDSPGKNAGVDCHFLLQGIFLNQGLNPFLLHWQVEQPGKPMSVIQIDILSFFFPSYLGHHRSLNRVPCAIQWVLICYLIHTQSMYKSIPVSQFIAPTWCPYICSPCLCLYFCFASRPVCTNCFERKLLHKFKFCNYVVDVYLFSVLLRAELGRAPDISGTHVFN